MSPCPETLEAVAPCRSGDRWFASRDAYYGRAIWRGAGLTWDVGGATWKGEDATLFCCDRFACRWLLAVIWPNSPEIGVGDAIEIEPLAPAAAKDLSNGGA